MIKQTFDAIQEAEAQAEQIIKDAEKRAAEILTSAKEEAQALQAQTGNKAKHYAAEQLQSAQNQRNIDAQLSLETMQAQIAALKEAVSKKEDAAVRLVIDNLI